MDTFLDFVENKVKQDPSHKLLGSAAASLKASLRASGSSSIDDASLRLWIASMVISGLRHSTRRKYLGELASAFRDWRNTDKKPDATSDADNPFLLAKDLEKDFADQPLPLHATENLNRIPRLLNLDPASGPYETASLFLYLLYNIDTRLQDAVRLRFSDPLPPLSQIEDIVESMRISSPRKRYVFGLDQGKKREGQIIRDTIHAISRLLSDNGFDFGGEFSRDSILSLWTAAALKGGVPLHNIRSVLESVPGEYSSLGLLARRELPSDARNAILQRVADTINDNTPRWFVFRMRHGVTPDDVREAAGIFLGTAAGEIMYYHPTHTVVSLGRKGRRIKEEKPWLPGILFVRIRKDRISRLLRGIGHLAWCYRWANTPDSPYCMISTAEMKAFQRHVGSFTSDIKMELLTRDTPLEISQTVRINGAGILQNRIGVIQSMRNANGTRTYTISLSSRDYATWTVRDIDEALLEPIIPNAI